MSLNRRTFLATAALAALAKPSQAAAVKEPDLIEIPAGKFRYGSTAEEREYGYQLDEAAYGHSRTRDRGWYAREAENAVGELPSYKIAKTPITNALYQVFVEATDHRIPMVTPEVWASYRLIHPYDRTHRHSWEKTGRYPEGRGEHPVVMVSHSDATAFASWLSEKTGKSWRLPTEWEWEKAARGDNGHIFPWGDTYDPTKLNSHDKGPFDTMPVGNFPTGASPYGVLDMAGNIFEWTSSAVGTNRHLVKGGSWDDRGCGVCRAAARHSRPNEIKHILVGFRLVQAESL